MLIPLWLYSNIGPSLRDLRAAEQPSSGDIIHKVDLRPIVNAGMAQSGRRAMNTLRKIARIVFSSRACQFGFEVWSASMSVRPTVLHARIGP